MTCVHHYREGTQRDREWRYVSGKGFVLQESEDCRNLMFSGKIAHKISREYVIGRPVLSNQILPALVLRILRRKTQRMYVNQYLVKIFFDYPDTCHFIGRGVWISEI